MRKGNIFFFAGYEPRALPHDHPLDCVWRGRSPGPSPAPPRSLCISPPLPPIRHPPPTVRPGCQPCSILLPGQHRGRLDISATLHHSPPCPASHAALRNQVMVAGVLEGVGGGGRGCEGSGGLGVLWGGLGGYWKVERPLCPQFLPPCAASARSRGLGDDADGLLHLSHTCPSSLIPPAPKAFTLSHCYSSNR